MAMTDRQKCEVNGTIVKPCKFLEDSCEFGNPIGKKKGIFCWDLYKLGTTQRENTRRFFGIKGGNYINGLKFEYCPFCGVKHSTSEDLNNE